MKNKNAKNIISSIDFSNVPQELMNQMSLGFLVVGIAFLFSILSAIFNRSFWYLLIIPISFIALVILLATRILPFVSGQTKLIQATIIQRPVVSGQKEKDSTRAFLYVKDKRNKVYKIAVQTLKDEYAVGRHVDIYINKNMEITSKGGFYYIPYTTYLSVQPE